jgi:putative intracellular protease/amidase
MELSQRRVLMLAADDWADEAAVVDGHLISARTPADLSPWMKVLLRALDPANSPVAG